MPVPHTTSSLAKRIAVRLAQMSGQFGPVKNPAFKFEVGEKVYDINGDREFTVAERFCDGEEMYEKYPRWADRAIREAEESYRPIDVAGGEPWYRLIPNGNSDMGPFLNAEAHTFKLDDEAEG